MPGIYINEIFVPCRGILFDKDGTLLDFMQLWGDWANTLTELLEGHLAVLGARLPVEKSRLIGLRYDQDNHVGGYDKTGPLAMGTEEEVTALLAWQLYVAGVPWNEAVVQVRQFSASAMVEVEKRRSAHPIPGLKAFLSSCRLVGIELGVVTSDTTPEAIKHLEWLGIRDYFRSVVGRDRVVKGKPDPEMAILAMHELGVPPEECLVFGDSNADMAMGKQAGVYWKVGIALEGGGASYLLDADVIVPGYEKLTAAFEEAGQQGGN
ncbi:phosphoglycolate phosphatase [Fontibacillus phaseoli]|uniref:Phosphoglycolate phosphatase n=1 Tax=Fontibacillus phaseoli TaxID=1416533 RepID=A0A369BPW1_9BACL|nr:HAD family phosphatase [Fontibacillus phaseoli]RCX22487.1 phosphoglycolate phosphatase [Fontibacillus phaseoli]